MTTEFDPAGGEAMMLYDAPRPRRTGIWVVCALIVVALVAVLVFVGLPARRDMQKYDDAHAAYLAGDCELALEEIEAMLDSFRVFDFTRRAADAKDDRDECRAYLRIADVAADDPADALLSYLDLVQRDPPSPLRDAAVTDGRALAEASRVADLASVDTCDAVLALRDNGLLPPTEIGTLRAACVDVLDDAGFADEAAELAVRVLTDHGDEPAAAVAADYLSGSADGCAELAEQSADLASITAATRARCLRTLDAAEETGAAYDLALAVLRTGDTDGAGLAATIVVSAEQACFEIESLLALKGLTARAANLEALLLRCIDEATEAGDTDGVAALRLEYLTRLANDPDANAVRTVFLADVASCALADEVDAAPSLRTDTAFLADYSFNCGQYGEFIGAWSLAVRMYEAFLEAAPLDERAPTVQTGLANSLIALAKSSQSRGLLPPGAVGESGSRSAEVVVFNMTSDELRVVVRGAEGGEAIVQTIPAITCADVTSATECRIDAPSATFSLAAGTYDVLIDGDPAGPLLGTWDLERGTRYLSCIVAASG